MNSEPLSVSTPQRRNRCRDVVKASGMIATVTTDQADSRTVLVREHAPAINLLFIDPAVAVERLAHLRRGHRRELGQHEIVFYPAFNQACSDSAGRLIAVAWSLSFCCPSERRPARMYRLGCHHSMAS